MKRLHDHFPALCRLYAGGDAVVSWYNSFANPYSALSKVAHTQDGSVLLWLMAIAGAVIVLDVVLNDLTPETIPFGFGRLRLSWWRAWRYRHLLFVLLAFCYAAQPYVAERSGNGVSLIVFFYWNSFQNITIAFFDARQRSRSQGWQRAYS